MPDTTLAKARKCPKCNNYGELIQQGPTTDPKYTAYIFKCMQLVCPWYDTQWVVTADEDDKVPMMDIGHTKKVFPKREDITPAQRKRIRETFDDV